MTDAPQTVLDAVLDGLMARHRDHVPDVAAVLGAMVHRRLVASASEIENDHIAFRTMGVAPLGIPSLERVFLHHGYKRRDHYYFPEKKLDASWYHPPNTRHPRVFISELRVRELSADAQAIIHRYIDQVRADPVDFLDLDDPEQVIDFLHRPLWPTPKWFDYERLAAESEFAAWVIYNRYYLNHFTIAIHNLPPGFNTLDGFNRFLEECGVTLNDAGGKIKVSADGKLRQSSTVAALVDGHFDDGRGGVEVHPIPGSYVEFIERRVLDSFAHLPPSEILPEHRREGFEARSADKIFESTFDQQARRHRRP